MVKRRGLKSCLKSINDVFRIPIAYFSNHADGVKYLDREALPKCEKDNPFDAQKFPHRIPFLQIILSRIIQLDQTVQRISNTKVHNDGNVKEGAVRAPVPRIELALALQYDNDHSRDDLDEYILQHPVLAIDHELPSHLPLSEDFGEEEAVSAVFGVLDAELQGQFFLPAQQLDDVVDERGQDEGLVQFSKCANVLSGAMKEQGEPRLDGKYWNHE